MVSQLCEHETNHNLDGDFGSHAITSYLICVALGKTGRPTAVPPLIPEKGEGKRRRAEAKVRRQRRLQLIGKSKI